MIPLKSVVAGIHVHVQVLPKACAGQAKRSTVCSGYLRMHSIDKRLILKTSELQLCFYCSENSYNLHILQKLS